MRTITVFFAGNERGGAATHLLTLARTIQAAETKRPYLFVSLGGGPLYDAIVQSGVTCECIQSGFLGAVRRLTVLLKRDRQTILHAHGPRMNIIAALAAKRADAPWTSTIHSHPLYDFLGSSFKSKVYPKLHMWSLRQAEGLFVVQPDLADVLPTKTVLDVPNAIENKAGTVTRDAAKRQWNKRLNLPDNTRFIGVAARFDPVKNLSVLVQAIAHLADDSIVALLAGDGEERAMLESLAASLGVADRVRFLGFLTDMPAFYAALDVHVLPSKSEGTPFSVLEAGMFGAVNVCSDIRSLRRLLEDGKAGCLVPVGDANMLANTIDMMMTDEVTRQRLVEHFQQQVLTQFEPEKMLCAYERGYTVLEEDILRSRRYQD